MIGVPSIPAPGSSVGLEFLFPGVSCNCAPPDTNGEVGKTQYLQMVNEGLQVFDKLTGTSLLGPIAISSIWSGFGGSCQNGGNGDPVVIYDQLADRWIISQFATPSGASVPQDECIAISQTGDATGAWYRYGFHLTSNFLDYPKLGVWPDGYYMAANVFNTAGTAIPGTSAIRVRSGENAGGRSYCDVADTWNHRRLQRRDVPTSRPGRNYSATSRRSEPFRCISAG